jgi:hypothetical protein
VTRLVVVSPATALAAALSAGGYQVVQQWPEAFEAWRGSGVGVDAFILDLRSATAAVDAATRLRSRVALVPVLLVATDQPGWDSSELHELPATRVLPLPGSATDVLSALQDLGVEPWAAGDTTAGPATAPGQRQAVQDALGELTLDTRDLLSEDDDLDARITALPPLEPEPAEPPRHARDDGSQ